MWKSIIRLDFLTKVCYTYSIMKKIKQKTKKFTLAALAVGAVILPIQSTAHDAASHTPIDNDTAKVKLEQHTHPDHIKWQHHVIDPRAIRAVGHDSGKDSEKDSLQDPWKMYNARAA